MSVEQIILKENRSPQVQAEKLFLEHGNFLMSVLLKDLPEHDALDVFQDLYLNVATKGIPENIDNVKGYLYRAAINDIIDFKRKSSTYNNKIQNYSQRAQNFKPNNDPAEKLMRFSLLMKVFKEIEKHLCPSVNEVFVQKFQYNLDHQGIADKLNLKKETVNRYLSIGTKQIQELRDQFFGALNE